MITKQPFGRTGQESTRIIFGAAALGRASQEEADRTLEVLLQHGINHIDTASSYGEAEARIGPWMREHRQKFFLATKMKERTYQQARDEFYRSLGRLRVDQVDLLQLHNLVDQIEWQTALGPDGALKFALEAKEQGLVRYIGVTGHGLSIAAMHLRSLKEFDFDSVLLPCNFVTMQNPKYAADFDALIALCKERNVAVQTIKAIARRPWGVQATRSRTTWYEPLEEQADIDLAVSWVLSHPDIFLNTASDMQLLPKILDAASRFDGTPPDEQALKEKMLGLEMASLFV